MADFNMPPITDEDIAWAVDILNLPKNAFSPEKDGGARERILKSSNETLDISACPGSGKTTLLVAKLAILARNWPYRCKGICVLSHTNVAKDEIEKRLGGTDVGQALLSYPHYIGTIHGFVNEFLALPWLRANNYPPRVIEDSVTLEWRWKSLPEWIRTKILRSPANQQYPKHTLKIINKMFDVKDISTGINQVISSESKEFNIIRGICKKSYASGFMCFDEMFIWSDEILSTTNDLNKTLRNRFPLLFLDEVQDNSEIQSEMLSRIFIEGENPVCRLRFGDSDQEIFDSARKSNRAVTDQFPSGISTKVFDLPNSHRFGQDIARLASPLSVGSVSLVGQGPKNGESKNSCHAIFLVDEETVINVLDVYGEYLLSVFTDDQQVLNSMVFTAVGAVHRDNGDDHIPRHVIHYWNGYDPDITKADPLPSTFLQYIQAGHRIAEKTATDSSGGESFAAVERLAMGILYKASELCSTLDSKPRKKNHRFVVDLLSESTEVLKTYFEIVTVFSIERKFPSEDDWKQVWMAKIVKVIATLSGVSLQNDDSFFLYPSTLIDDENNTRQPQRNNLYAVTDSKRTVSIRLGSIHSVKGETHTATLVLETFDRAHHLNKIAPRFQGNSKGKVDESMEKRLKLHYVAMTRPSHLLCLAMKKSTFEDNTGSIDIKKIEKLKAHAWGKVGVVKSNGACEWI